MKELISHIFFAFLCFVIGYQARALYPTRSDKNTAKSHYVIACLDGQISVLEMYTKGKEFKTCEDMNRVK